MGDESKRRGLFDRVGRRRSGGGAASRPGQDEEEERLSERIASVSTQPTRTAEEIRAALRREQEARAEESVLGTPRFEDRYSAESLYVSADEIVEVDPADPWGVLGVRPDAPWREVVQAHRHLARLHHPDRLGDVDDARERAAAEDRMCEINVAYSQLRQLTGH